jgi:hypothetical protein
VATDAAPLSLRLCEWTTESNGEEILVQAADTGFQMHNFASKSES